MKRIIATVAVCALAGIAAAGCGEEETDTTGTDITAIDTATAPTTDTTATTPGGATDTTQPPAPDTAKQFEVTIANGQPTEVGLWQVAPGDAVEFTITSDVADEVHLHGYDVKVDVQPGTTATLTLDAADVEGNFELELEEAGVLLGNLRVSS